MRISSGSVETVMATTHFGEQQAATTKLMPKSLVGKSSPNDDKVKNEPGWAIMREIPPQTPEYTKHFYIKCKSHN